MDEKTLNTVANALHWEARYRKGEHLSGKGAFLPEIGGLDPDFEKTLDLFGVGSGRLLEIGAGTGTQAIRFAELGFEVTATDVSASAVENAKKSAKNTPRLEFLADDILRTALQGPYDLIVDRGCYTLLDEWMREEYCRNVRKLISPDGLLLLKVDAGKAVTEQLAARFAVLESWETRYHEVKGPKAAFHVFEPLPA